MVDGLYVIKTDWLIPASASWTAISPTPTSHPLQGQNNAVFVSLMTPSTTFGGPPPLQPPAFRNIFVEDAPRVLFSLKILPPICAPTGLVCPKFNPSPSSTLNLNIENLFSPASIVENSIGFQHLPTGYTQDGVIVPAATTLAGSMTKPTAT